jgi:hypothetical protein
MCLLRLSGRVLQVRGPVWKVEPAGAGTMVHLGTERRSCVRAHFADGADLRDVREGRPVDLVGRCAFRGDHVLLEDARLSGDTRPPAPPAYQQTARSVDAAAQRPHRLAAPLSRVPPARRGP